MKGRVFIEKLCEITLGKQNMRLLARETGVSENVISCIKNGQQSCKFSPEYASLIVKRYPHVNRMWLIAPDDVDEPLTEYQEIEGGIAPFARIEAICNHYRISVPQLEKELGVSENLLYNLKSRTKNISVPLFRTIINHYPELSPAWVSQGMGDMFLVSEPEPLPEVMPATTYVVGGTTANEEAAALAASLHEERIQLEATIAEARELVLEVRDLLSQMREGVAQANTLRDAATRLVSGISRNSSYYANEDFTPNL